MPDIVSKSNREQAFSFKELHINAVSIFTADEVRSLSVAQRKCRFLDESELDISPVYSYNLCKMQCRSELCYKLCHCVPHFYRHTGKF